MLEPEVDEGYFTPIASTTLSSIFRDNLENENLTNTSLKYKAPNPKNIEQSAKSDDPNATQLVYSCSLTAYEWVNGAHKYKTKVGFAILQENNTSRCKIILYTPDKSTLSCTTVSAQLEVTIKGTVISLYDDHKKYWGLCFNEKTIHEVTKLLQKENVGIHNYESNQLTEINNETSGPDIENLDNEATSDETDGSNGAKENVFSLNDEKASILNRMANLGHAILPSTPVTPVKKPSMVNRLLNKEQFGSSENFKVLPDVSESSKPRTLAGNDISRSEAVQSDTSNTQHDNISPTNIKYGSQQHMTSNIPLVNNQVFAYVNGCMVPVHIPVLDKLECDISSAEIEIIVKKLTRLQGHLKTKELLKINANTQNTSTETNCSCGNKRNDGFKDISNITANDLYEQNLTKISNLEDSVREKSDAILKLQNKLKIEEQKCIDILQKHDYTSTKLNNEIEDLKQTLISKDNLLESMVPKSEASSLIANTVKKLMNDTFRTLSSNFENEESYSGCNVKGILAAVIKKCTVETLSVLHNPHDSSSLPVEPTD